jgi:hypothetical protein
MKRNAPDLPPTKPKLDEIEELPDAWERFERAFDTVMQARPRPKPAKDRAPSPKRGEKRDGKEPA